MKIYLNYFLQRNLYINTKKIIFISNYLIAIYINLNIVECVNLFIVIL